MADNYLITGYWGEPHVTAENDRGINAAMFGAGRFVLPVGEQFKAEYIGNNTIRMYDGKLMDNGAAAGIPVGEYVDLLIANAGQGMKRNDLIVFQYEQDASTLIESGKFVVIQGTETNGTASDPELTQEDLLSGEATFDQMALWRVSISGATISAPVQVFTKWGAFAPAGCGYGDGAPYIGAEAGQSYTDKIDALVASWGNGTAKQYATYDANLSTNAMLATIYKYSANAILVVASGFSGSILTRMKSSGVWLPWEWVNPPMKSGVEYRTTERMDGKPVYSKVLVTDVPATEYASLTVPISPGSQANLVDVIGILKSKSTNEIRKLPDFDGATGDIAMCITHTDKTNVYASTQKNMSNYKLYITVKYTKD